MRPRGSIPRIARSLPFALFAAGMPTAYAADLYVGEPRLRGGEVSVDVSVATQDYESLAGLQFDLNFDREAYTLSRVELGHSADEAGKEAVYTGDTPGHTRVLVTGMNQDEIADGVVATVVLEPIGDLGGATIDVDGAVMSDPFGYRIAVEDVKQAPNPLAEESRDTVEDDGDEASVETSDQLAEANEVEPEQQTDTSTAPTDNAGADGPSAASDSSPDFGFSSSGLRAAPDAEASDRVDAPRRHSRNAQNQAGDTGSARRSQRPHYVRNDVAGSASSVSSAPSPDAPAPRRSSSELGERYRVARATPQSASLDHGSLKTRSAADSRSPAVLDVTARSARPIGAPHEGGDREPSARLAGAMAGLIAFAGLLALRWALFGASVMRRLRRLRMGGGR